MHEVDMRALEHLKVRLEEMKRERDESCRRMEEARERGDAKGVLRANIRLTHATQYITRYEGDIFALAKKLGVDPEGVGEPSE